MTEAEAAVADLTGAIARLQRALGAAKANKLVRQIVEGLGAPARPAERPEGPLE